MLGQWINQYIEIPFYAFLCHRFGLHKINWTRWDGVEQCICDEVVRDTEGHYVEKDDEN